MTGLAVVGGEVLAGRPGTGDGVAWRNIDVFVDKGRIVPGATSVRMYGETVDGAGGPNEVRTGGAGAERATRWATVEGNAVTAARLTGLAAAGCSVLDASGLRVVPGLIDLQCNGGHGIDLSRQPERLWELAALLPRTGVTAWLPTVISGPPAVRARALVALRAGPPPEMTGPLATPLGLHFEGPLLAPERRGAHPADWLRRPDEDEDGDGDGAEDEDGDGASAAGGWSRWSREAGVALVTLAPELPGALPLVRGLVERGVVVSAGHSSATAAQATAAVDAGVRWVTHLFNAMAPLHHREPGLAGVALTDERVRVGIIADGVHLHPATVALAARALGDRLTLVTDAVAAAGTARATRTAGAAAGVARAAGATAVAAGTAGVARAAGATAVAAGTAGAGGPGGGVRLADGTLAGSDLSLDRAVSNLISFAGVPAAEAVVAATAVPAAVLGLPDRGAVVPGAAGDLVLLDPAGEVVATVVGGDVAYDRRVGIRAGADTAFG